MNNELLAALGMGGMGMQGTGMPGMGGPGMGGGLEGIPPDLLALLLKAQGRTVPQQPAGPAQGQMTQGAY